MEPFNFEPCLKSSHDGTRYPSSSSALPYPPKDLNGSIENALTPHPSQPTEASKVVSRRRSSMIFYGHSRRSCPPTDMTHQHVDTVNFVYIDTHRNRQSYCYYLLLFSYNRPIDLSQGRQKGHFNICHYN